MSERPVFAVFEEVHIEYDENSRQTKVLDCCYGETLFTMQGEYTSKQIAEILHLLNRIYQQGQELGHARLANTLRRAIGAAEEVGS